MYVGMCLCLCMCVDLFLCMYVCTGICLYVYMCTCVYVITDACVYVWLCLCQQSVRTKFKHWLKKYEKMEEMHLEFEAAAEENPKKLAGFMEDVQERYDNMAAFKKTFQKFQMSVEAALKKVATL